MVYVDPNVKRRLGESTEKELDRRYHASED